MYSRDIADLETQIRKQERSLGGDHPEVAELLTQLAHLYFVFGRYGDAERTLWRAVAICTQTFGQENLSAARLYEDLGYMMETQERMSEAEHVYRLAYAVRTVKLGPGHADTMHAARCVVKVMRAQGKIPLERELERFSQVAVSV